MINSPTLLDTQSEERVLSDSSSSNSCMSIEHDANATVQGEQFEELRKSLGLGKTPNSKSMKMQHLERVRQHEDSDETLQRLKEDYNKNPNPLMGRMIFIRKEYLREIRNQKEEK